MGVNKENTEALMIEDDTKDIVINRINEKINCEEGATVVSKETLGHSWIVGSSTNGLVGTNTGTEDGEQQVVGGAGRVTTISSVTSPNDSYRERFYDTTFKDASTTADWGSTPGQLDMTDTEIAVSSSIAYNDGTISHATISLSILSGDEDDLAVELTSDGTNWESVTINTQHDFTDTGTDLRFKLTASSTVSISLVRVVYS